MIYTAYTGPAKPIPTYRMPLIEKVEVVVFLSGFIVAGLDVFLWRANIPAF